MKFGKVENCGGFLLLLVVKPMSYCCSKVTCSFVNALEL